MRIKNPIGARLAFVRKQYPNRPEVFEITEGIVARALGVSRSEIDPDAFKNWEKAIPWLAQNVNLLLKKRDQGANVDRQLEILSRSFIHIVTPIVDRPKRKGHRQVELATLSPKQARKFSSRLISEKIEKRREAASQAGYRIVKNLGNGYVAAVGTPDLNAPPFPFNSDIEKQKHWVNTYARFQGAIGARMHNCLGFFNKEYGNDAPVSKFETQRKGGKLYAVLDGKGEPVAATLTDANNNVIETNGPGNRPPPESAQPYIEKLEKEMGWVSGAKTAFHPPRDFDLRISAVIERLLDSYYFTENLRERRYFVRKASGYSRQAGADFSKVWPKFVIHILATSKYSAIASVNKTDHSKKKEVIAAILKVARLYKSGGTMGEFGATAQAAGAAGAWEGAAGEAARAARLAGEAARATGRTGTAAWSWAQAAGAAARAAAGAWARAAWAAAAGEAWSWEAVEREAVGAGSWEAGALEAAAIKDYAGYLLKLMHEAASNAGRNLQEAQRNPRRHSGVDPLITRCQKLWDAYYSKPTKRNLASVFKHLDVMKTSKSKRVLAERSRCLRVAKGE